MSKNSELSVVILAAGKGTRMKSEQAKVLHEVLFKPMLHHVLDAVAPLSPKRSIVIVGHQEERVRESLQGYAVEIVTQKEQLGTGHAVHMAEGAIPEGDGVVLILCGDTPLITTRSLQEMYTKHVAERAQLTLMTTILEEPKGYGRIISQADSISAIVEEKEASNEQKKITEVNAGIYLVNRSFLFEALATVTPENSQGEFYLTDIVEYGVTIGRKVQKSVNSEPIQVLGVNSKVELAAAHRHLQKQRNIELMQQGITILNDETVTISLSAKIGIDTILSPNVTILGETVIGRSCTIGSGAVIRDCKIGDFVQVGANSVLSHCNIDDNIQIAPLTLKEQ
jgi:bifunctional UDP-N-acetylglucosamine pyrophosphorylase/glucosamine-1-phosphate N-acetyltransferase